MGFSEEYERFTSRGSQAFAEVRQSIRLASWHHIFLASFGIILSIIGQGAQLIAVNFWLSVFPDSYQQEPCGGPLSVLISASAFLVVAFIAIFIFHCVKEKPELKFMRNPTVWLYSALGGACWATNGLLLIFATPKIPELYQSVLTSLMIVWTFIFAIVFKVNNGRNYCHVLVLLAVVFTIAGIILGTLSVKTQGGHYSDVGAWALIFSLGALPGGLSNVVSQRYMQKCAYDDRAEDPAVRKEEERKWNERNTPSSSYLDGITAAGNNNETNSNNMNASMATASESNNNNTNTTDGEASPLLLAKNSKKKPSSSSKNNNNDKNLLLRSPSSLSDLSSRSGESANTFERRKLSKKKRMTEDGNHWRAHMATAKPFFLAVASVAQLITFFALIPIDSLEWFGTHPNNITAVTYALKNGVRCSVNLLPDDTTPLTPSLPSSNSSSSPSSSGGNCADSSKYYYMFSAAFVASTAGSMIVSSFSAVLASIVCQISAPLTTVLLIAAPSLSPAAEEANVLMCSFAVFLIVAGTMVYSFWEQMMSARKKNNATRNPYADSSDSEEVEDEGDGQGEAAAGGNEVDV